MPRVCAVADIHNQNIVTEPADILIVAGDLTHSGTIPQLTDFRKWLVAQPQKHKVVIAGNHDFCFDNEKRQEAEVMMGGDGIIYLRDQEVTVEGLRIYGTPWQPWFFDWAFNLERGPEIALKWKNIPRGLDILVTHGPPHGYGDYVSRGERVGCEDLLKAIAHKKPRFNFFGHIHEDTGNWRYKSTTIVNCSVGPGRNSKLSFVVDIEPQSK